LDKGDELACVVILSQAPTGKKPAKDNGIGGNKTKRTKQERARNQKTEEGDKGPKPPHQAEKESSIRKRRMRKQGEMKKTKGGLS